MSKSNYAPTRAAFAAYTQTVLQNTRNKVAWLQADRTSESYKRLQEEIRKFDPELARLGDAVDDATVEASEKLIKYLAERTEN